VIIGIVSAVLRYYFPLEHYMVTIDSGLFVGIIAGGIAFLIGRSRRGAFVSAALGVMLTNVFLFLYYLGQGLEYPIVVGVGAQFSAIVVAAVSAAIIAEVAGEIMEYKRRGETDVMFMNIDEFVNTSE
jgi:signal transduction histidine kinase